VAEILRIARQLAATRPAAMLPCPVCAAALRAANLDAHLAKLHPGADPGTEWTGTGLRGGRLSATGDQLTLRRWAGLRRAAVATPHRVVVGPLTRTRLDPTMTSYADEFNVSTVTTRAGVYLEVEGRDGHSVVIRCRNSGALRKSWEGWAPGRARRRWDISLTDGDFVAVQYALAGRGLLQPRS
jgi:hypothetical protein